MATDELVVIDLPPGEEWLGLVTRLWLDEVPFLPLDQLQKPRTQTRGSN